MPECAVDELIPLFMDAGPRMAGGMGATALNAQELCAWCLGTGNALTPWEFATVLAMSRAYHAEFEDASDPGRPPPWTDPDAEAVDRKRVERATRGMLGDAMRAQQRQAGR